MNKYLINQIWSLLLIPALLLTACAAVGIAYACQDNHVYAHGPVSGELFFSGAASNDDGQPQRLGRYRQVDPGDDGRDPLQNQDEGVPCERLEYDSAVTTCTLSLMKRDYLFVDVDNAYPGYSPTIFFTLKNTYKFPVKIGKIEIEQPGGINTAVYGIYHDFSIGSNEEVHASLCLNINDVKEGDSQPVKVRIYAEK